MLALLAGLVEGGEEDGDQDGDDADDDEELDEGEGGICDLPIFDLRLTKIDGGLMSR